MLVDAKARDPASKREREQGGRAIMAAQNLQQKNLDTPDETRTFENGKAQVVTLGDFSASRLTVEPGWRWSEHVKSLAGTDSCQVLHTGYQVSGRLRIRMDDGTEKEYGPGDAYVIPPGHDGWVVGDEPVVTVDMSTVTAEHFAKEE
jgi:quercetin dioxygenase-like cupin family protein